MVRPPVCSGTSKRGTMRSTSCSTSPCSSASSSPSMRCMYASAARNSRVQNRAQSEVQSTTMAGGPEKEVVWKPNWPVGEVEVLCRVLRVVRSSERDSSSGWKGLSGRKWVRNQALVWTFL